MEMFSLDPVASMGMVAAQKPIKREDTEAEFAKIFYRELFRQVFSSSSMGEVNPLLPSVDPEMFIDQLAAEMVKKNLVPLGIR
jgi:hypothetical protein